VAAYGPGAAGGGKCKARGRGLAIGQSPGRCILQVVQRAAQPRRAKGQRALALDQTARHISETAATIVSADWLSAISTRPWRVS